MDGNLGLQQNKTVIYSETGDHLILGSPREDKHSSVVVTMSNMHMFCYHL